MMVEQSGKTFGMNEPGHFLGKLEWELQRLMTAGDATPEELAYHAMNIALTAWHMAPFKFRDDLGLSDVRFAVQQHAGHTLPWRDLHQPVQELERLGCAGIVDPSIAGQGKNANIVVALC